MRGRTLLLLALLAGAATAFCEEVPNAEPLTRIAFGSCNREYKTQPLWQPILACKPAKRAGSIWLGAISRA